MNTRILSIFAACAILATSCSVDLSIGGQDPAEAAVELIETDLSEIIGLGPIDATCESPESVEVGMTWGCTGVADDGTIDFVVEIDREDHINVETSNVITASQVQAVAQEASSSVNSALGSSLGSDAFDCGGSSIILDASNDLICAVDTGTETIDTTVTITDMEDTRFEVDLAPLEDALAVGALDAAAIEVIEGELAELIGLGPLTANCEDSPSEDVGTTWTCTADVAGDTAMFAVVVDSPNNVNVNTTNVVLADQVQAFAAAAMQQLNESVGASLPDEAMDCGDTSIILSASNEFACALDAGDGILDATIMITDPATGAFTVEVADAPAS